MSASLLRDGKEILKVTLAHAEDRPRWHGSADLRRQAEAAARIGHLDDRYPESIAGVLLLPNRLNQIEPGRWTATTNAVPRHVDDDAGPFAVF